MLDQWFLFLLFTVAAGLVAFGGFLIAVGFTALTEGKAAAKQFWHSEW